jgi:hypothetical protein
MAVPISQLRPVNPQQKLDLESYSLHHTVYGHLDRLVDSVRDHTFPGWNPAWEQWDDEFLHVPKVNEALR